MNPLKKQNLLRNLIMQANAPDEVLVATYNKAVQDSQPHY